MSVTEGSLDILYLLLCFAIEILIDGHPLKWQNAAMIVGHPFSSIVDGFVYL